MVVVAAFGGGGNSRGGVMECIRCYEPSNKDSFVPGPKAKIKPKSPTQQAVVNLTGKQ